MLDRNSAKPLYSQMEDLILEKLKTGEWAPGTMIASENELSRKFGISRMTVRNVLTKLSQEGLLSRIPGKGTFVAESKIVAKSLSYAGIREQLEQMGYEVSTELLSFSKKKASKELMAIFPFMTTPTVFVIKRLRRLKDEPFSIHTSYIPVELCPDLNKFDLLKEQLCSILSTNYNLNQTRTIETLESVAACENEAKLLKISVGQPLLQLHDIIIGENGEPFEFANVIFRGEKIKIKLEF